MKTVNFIKGNIRKKEGLFDNGQVQKKGLFDKIFLFSKNK